MPFLVFSSIGATELLIILAIVVVLFGSSRIADIGGALGRSIRTFRKELKEPEEEQKQATKAEESKPRIEPPRGGPPYQH